MKAKAFAGSTALLFAAAAWAASSQAEAPRKTEEAARVEEPAGEKPAASQAELEARFRDTLRNAVLEGRWRLVEDGKLGEERTDRYILGEVRKLKDDLWLIDARIQYGGKDVSVPVPVRVKWAGDTPVITVTDAAIPGLGTYTARVLIYKDVYSGVWFGPGHGGFLSGTIRRDEGK